MQCVPVIAILQPGALGCILHVLYSVAAEEYPTKSTCCIRTYYLATFPQQQQWQQLLLSSTSTSTSTCTQYILIDLLIGLSLSYRGIYYYYYYQYQLLGTTTALCMKRMCSVKCEMFMPPLTSKYNKQVQVQVQVVACHYNYNDIVQLATNQGLLAAAQSRLLLSTITMRLKCIVSLAPPRTWKLELEVSTSRSR